MDSFERIEKAQDILAKAMAQTMSGEMASHECRDLASAGYTIVKGEEVKLHHRIAAARGEIPRRLAA